MSDRYHLVDLMGDVKTYAKNPAEIVVHIVKCDRGYRVLQDGRMADGLAFDEMLGQVVNLLHPKLGKPHYRMMDRDEIAGEEARRNEQFKEKESAS